MREKGFKTIGFLLLLVFALFSLSRGETLISKNKNTLSMEDRLAKNSLEHYQKFSRLSNSYFVYEGDSTEEKVTTDVYGFKGKSVKRAFVYSLIVPGAGEFYANSKIKTVLFFGLDATLWTLYFNYHKKGKNKENKYKGFADQHWIEDDYREWLIDSLGITSGSDQDSFWNKKETRYDWLSHHLPDKKDQQYYEMIGKYDQFKFGWDDFPVPDTNQALRNAYLNMRRDSNNLLNKAKYSVMFSLANHILSAFDAAIAVKKHNRKGERFSQIHLQMRLSERDDEIVPKLSMSMKF
ncbi:MAG: hypothetical protein MUO91_00180 [candidate division Zixibacteria bacterium]|nr:hypothetical protein [candidate division Zixibacteria bacterium]